MVNASAWADEPAQKSRLSMGGYGEAVMSRHFYSDNFKRYTNADQFKDADSYGRFDLPHVVINIGYDFGHGWTMGSEIEFEHGGSESAVEIEEEETGEYETEVERGGEVALEQFWIQKSWSRALNLRMGHIIVPVGLTNMHHMPNEFFTVYRPEGESSILPCTWHQTGISLWGRTSDWRYEAQFIAGLEADLFGSQNWIKKSSASPYEFDVANKYAAVLRLDNYSVAGLRMGLSGYLGRTAGNSLKAFKYSDIKGDLLIGAFDFTYNDHNWIIRGCADYGHLSDSQEISKINRTLGKGSVSPQTQVASAAYCLGIEAGYDLFALSAKMRQEGQQLYLFGRYDSYDSMYKTEGAIVDNPCWSRQVYTVGLNYKPLAEITVKAEYAYRQLKSQFNDEPTLSLGVTYAGWWK
jgi:opacity protein-like surface antigen